MYTKPSFNFSIFKIFNFIYYSFLFETFLLYSKIKCDEYNKLK